MSLTLRRPRTARIGSAGTLLAWTRALSLDAPLVALAWQAFVAHELDVTLRPVHVLTLAAATWLAYAGDRLLDGLRLEGGDAAPARHRIAIRHRGALTCLWGLVALVSGTYAFLTLSRPCRLAGLALLALVAVYFVASHLAPMRTRRGVPRELVVSLAFTLAVALFPLAESASSSWTHAAWPLFALLGASFMNLWAVACWERPEDLARGEVTLVTGSPRLRGAFPAASVLLALLALGAAAAGLAPHSGPLALALSLFALALLHPLDLSADAKPVLADLALLSPLLVVALA